MDNAVTNGFIHKNIKQKRSKSWDMRYHWLRDKNLHKQFRYYWAKGEENEGDYFTKHHPPKHHIANRFKYVFVPNTDRHKHQLLQCVSFLSKAARVCSYPGGSHSRQTPFADVAKPFGSFESFGDGHKILIRSHK